LETIYLIQTTIYTWLALGFQGYTYKSYSKVKLHLYATIQSATIEVADEISDDLQEMRQGLVSWHILV